MECLDTNGVELKAGDIVTVNVKYIILKVYDDGHVLVQKAYDIPATALTKTDETVAS